MKCLICGKEVDKAEIIFIETDNGICKECAKTLNEDYELNEGREDDVCARNHQFRENSGKIQGKLSKYSIRNPR